MEGTPDRPARGNSLRSGPTGLRSASYRDIDVRGGEFSRSDVRRISRSGAPATIPVAYLLNSQIVQRSFPLAFAHTASLADDQDDLSGPVSTRLCDGLMQIALRY